MLWIDPGPVERLDFASGVGGRDNAPKPPFTFIEESLSGRNPKVRVRDANGAEWTAKFGSEVNAETFATRIAWAVGYFVEPAYFVPSGKIESVGKLERAKKNIQPDGSFTDARRFAPDLCNLLDRVEIQVDLNREGRFDRMRLDVEVELDDGQIVSGSCDGPPGIWGRPAEPERLVGKARDCLSAVLPSEDAEAIVRKTNRFDELAIEDVLSLLDMLAHATGRKE